MVDVIMAEEKENKIECERCGKKFEKDEIIYVPNLNSGIYSTTRLGVAGAFQQYRGSLSSVSQAVPASWASQIVNPPQERDKKKKFKVRDCFKEGIVIEEEYNLLCYACMMKLISKLNETAYERQDNRKCNSCGKIDMQMFKCGVCKKGENSIYLCEKCKETHLKTHFKEESVDEHLKKEILAGLKDGQK